jgi:3-methyladenine DNA glycosylase AlkD
MPASRTASRKPSKPKSAAKVSTKAAPQSTRKSTPKSAAKASPKAAAKARMSLEEVMAFLEKSGTEQARKTYARRGVTGPMFGVSFGTLFTLVKKIGVDHDLALRLWDTGNLDARNLAYKLADPLRMTPADLDRWVRETEMRICAAYVSMLAEESGKGLETARRWLGSSDERLRSAGWGVVSQLAGRDASMPDSWFAERLAEIEKDIKAAPNEVRGAMNMALITIGGRSAALKKAALAASKRIGKVEVDHGDTACKTPEAPPYIEKMWARAKAMGFESPTAHESSHQTPRLRC